MGLQNGFENPAIFGQRMSAPSSVGRSNCRTGFWSRRAVLGGRFLGGGGRRSEGQWGDMRGVCRGLFLCALLLFCFFLGGEGVGLWIFGPVCLCVCVFVFNWPSVFFVGPVWFLTIEIRNSKSRLSLLMAGGGGGTTSQFDLQMSHVAFPRLLVTCN